MSNTATQLVFVDQRVANLEALIASIDSSFEVILVTPDQDGLAQIAAAVANAGEVSSIQVISHGSSGSLLLGSSAITEQTLDEQAVSLEVIKGALAEGADILLFGCNVAEGAAGLAFVQKLAELTGADVAASTDLTGSAAAGGDWDLEVSTGQIETYVETTSYEIALGDQVLAPTNASFENNLTGWTVDDGSISTGGTYKAGSNNWAVAPIDTKMHVSHLLLRARLDMRQWRIFLSYTAPVLFGVLQDSRSGVHH